MSGGRTVCLPKCLHCWFCVALGVLLWAATAGFTPCADSTSVGEYQVKAAFLYHFSKFVDWPNWAQSGDLFMVGIAGPDPFGPVLDLTFQDKTFHGKPIGVKRLDGLAGTRSCHILFISETEVPRIRRAIEDVAGLPVLTVGDSPEFTAAGGMIQLVVEESKVRFDINLGAAKRSGLRISSHLLRLARKVENK